jgi:hypothetical protein
MEDEHRQTLTARREALKQERAEQRDAAALRDNIEPLASALSAAEMSFIAEHPHKLPYWPPEWLPIGGNGIDWPAVGGMREVPASLRDQQISVALSWLNEFAEPDEKVALISSIPRFAIEISRDELSDQAALIFEHCCEDIVMLSPFKRWLIEISDRYGCVSGVAG